jgi:diaminopimelate epimerase
MSLDFQPKGTNVTLLKNKIDSAAEADAVTFERGVEDFTLGCGTGAVAAAFYLAEKYSFYKSSINMPGGSLFVDVSDKSKPKMIGQAQLIEEFEYEYVV